MTDNEKNPLASILLVDDHPANLLTLEAVLEPLSERLVRATSGRQALEHLLREEFAAVLLDVQMPGLDGFATAVLIKQDERTREVPIVFLTAIHREAADAARGYAHGAVDYITKPFDPDTLRERVAELVARWRARRTAPAAAGTAREGRAPDVQDGAKDETTQRARLREALAHVALPVLLLYGPCFRVEYVSPAFGALVGGPSVEGVALADAWPAMPDARIEDTLARVLETGTAAAIEEVSAPGERFARLTVEPTRDPDGCVRGVLVTGTDVTEQVRARRRAEQRFAAEQSARRSAEAVSQRKDEVLATVSHELRAPLNAILGWTNLLRQGSVTPERRAHALETIDRNARAQARLIEDLLDVSRMVTGGLRLARDAVDVAAVVRDAVEALRPTAVAKGLRLACSVPERLGSVAGDGDRLRQVVTNLVANAVKFTPAGGRVRVTAARAGGRAQIRVEDSGVGIEPELLPHVFEPFRQGEECAREGLGLGLAIVQRLVVLHGGDVRADSIGPGGGATFEVSLPLARAAGIDTSEGPIRRTAAGVECPPSLAGLRVLIVDDEPDAREWVAAALADCDAHPMLAGNAAEAFTTFRASRPDVVLSDIALPGEDGYSFVRRIRALPAERGGRTPALAVTAAARPEDRMLALAAGFDEHIAKPVEPAKLLPLVGRLAAQSSSG